LGRYGRPKLPASERRDAGALHIRLNEEERVIVEEKAAQAGVTAHEWARCAALERDPPKRQIIPELNQQAWLEMARLMATLNGAIWRFQPGGEESLRAAVEAVRGELAEVRNMLIGGSK
jgi:hypothetical protein